MKENKVKLTITLSHTLVKYLEENYTKKSRFIEYCIEKELEEYKKLKTKAENVGLDLTKNLSKKIEL